MIKSPDPASGAGRAEIATMRGYVEALGGEVEIVAKFGEERITVW
jgi:hypothetical protein